jgi:hypothetical protein
LYPELLSRACAIGARERDPEEVVQEILGFSWWNYAQAARKGRWLTAGQLAFIAMRRVRGEGSSLGSRRTKTDALSPACRMCGRSKILYLSNLGQGDHSRRLNALFDQAISQGQRNPANEAAVKIDWGALRSALPSRLQRVLDDLVAGRGTCEIAKRLRLSPGRICQLKVELGRSVAGFFGSSLPDWIPA